MSDVDTVDSIQTRLAEDGLATLDERGTTCCYAKQDKFWVEGAPNGERWEIYTVLEDSETFGVGDTSPVGCCVAARVTTRAGRSGAKAGVAAMSMRIARGIPAERPHRGTARQGLTDDATP